MLFISFSLAVLFAVFANSKIICKSIHIYLVTLITFFCVNILLAFQVTALLSRSHENIWFLSIQVGMLIITYIFFRERISINLKVILFEHFSIIKLKNFVKTNPLLAIFTLLIDIVYAINAYLIYIMPPNNNDGLYIHMARVGHWIKLGPLMNFSTYYPYQLFYPYNAQALIYWTVLFTESEKFVGFIQYLSAFFCCIVIYGFSRFLSLSESKSLFAATIFLSFPQVFFQSTTSQNDLITAAFLLNALYLLMKGLKENCRHFLAVSAISLGIALGIKQTAIFILPIFALIAVGGVIRDKKIFKNIINWIIALIISFVILGSGSYVKNLIEFKNPIGPKEVTTNFVGLQDNTPLHKAFILNTSRLLYQFVDTTALPPILEGYIFRGKAKLASNLFNSFGLPLDSTIAWYEDSRIKFDYYLRPKFQEDGSWFGIISSVTLPVTFCLPFFWAIRRKQFLYLIFPFSVISFHILEFLVRPGWDFYVGRNYLVPVAILSPLIGYLYKSSRRWKIFNAIIMILSGYMLINMVLNNESKPLIGRDAIWNLSRSEKITLQARMLRTPLDFVERKVPDGATIGLSPNTMEYPYFGERFTRNLTAVKPIENIANREWLIANNIDFLLVNKKSIPETIAIPFKPILSDKEWALYKVE